MHQKPCYWTRQRIHNVAKLRGNLILIHNFGHCLVSATGSIFLECVLFMRSLAKDTNEHNVLISFLFIYINIYIHICIHIRIELASKALPVWGTIQRGNNQPPLYSIEAHPSVSLLYLLLREISAVQPSTRIIDERIKNTRGTCTDSRNLV